MHCGLGFYKMNTHLAKIETKNGQQKNNAFAVARVIYVNEI